MTVCKYKSIHDTQHKANALQGHFNTLSERLQCRKNWHKIVTLKKERVQARGKVVKMNTPRMRTLPEAAAELKRMDNDTAITLTALRRMVKMGELPYISVASKRLINFTCLVEIKVFYGYT